MSSLYTINYNVPGSLPHSHPTHPNTQRANVTVGIYLEEYGGFIDLIVINKISIINKLLLSLWVDYTKTYQFNTFADQKEIHATESKVWYTQKKIHHMPKVHQTLTHATQWQTEKIKIEYSLTSRRAHKGSLLWVGP